MTHTFTSTTALADTPCHDRFTELCHAPLPRGLREKALGMSWDGFLTAYSNSAGPLSLSHWECTDTRRAARRLGPQARTYQATLMFNDRAGTASASASGPIAALTAMLYERGIALEVLNFHQLQMGRDTVTFVRGTDGIRDEWAMAWAEDPTQSALRAVITCVNRLMN